MKKTILFDIGNVLLFFDFNKALKALGIEDPSTCPELLEKFYRLRDKVETGEMPNADFLHQVADVLNYAGPLDELHDAYCDIFTPNEPMWDLVKETAGTCRRILFSNTSSVHVDYLLARYPDFELFDEAVFSYRVGFSKPDSAMYQDAIDRLGVDPENTFYIDDLLANVETGDDFGFTTHHYTSSRHEALVSDVNQFLNR